MCKLLVILLPLVLAAPTVAGCAQKAPPSGALPRLSAEIAGLETHVRNLPHRGELEEVCNKCRRQANCTASFAPQRLAALLDQAGAFSKITAVYFKYATPDVDECLDVEAGAEMKAALLPAREVVNRNAILFDADFNEDVDWYYEVFRQLNRLPVTEWAQYRVFVADLTNSFDEICKDRIGRMDGSGDRGRRMPLETIPYKERIGLKPAEHLQRHLKFWQSVHKGD